MLLALGASLVLVGPRGPRHLLAEQFFTGYMETALEPGELVAQVEIPQPEPGQRSV